MTAITMITRRMKWIIQQLKNHPDAVIKHQRDSFLGKDFYTLEWSDGCHEVTPSMRKRMTELKLIEVTEERPVYYRGKFQTTERDYGLPKGRQQLRGSST